MVRIDVLERVRGCLLGVAIGDALGAPFEHVPPGCANQAMERSGGKILDFHPWQDHPAGSWTDDTGLTIASCRALIRMKKEGLGLVDSHRRAMRERAGSKGCREPGKTVLHAAKYGESDVNAWSNGALMRIAPVGLFAALTRLSPQETASLAFQVAAFTHGHPLATFPAVECALAVRSILSGDEHVPEGLSDPGRFCIGIPEEDLARYPFYQGKRHAQLEELHPSTGLWMWRQVFEKVLGLSDGCRWSAMPGFEVGLLRAVNESWDRDTAGAVAGALLGVYWGEKAIPGRWVSGVEDGDSIAALADELQVVSFCEGHN
jgi:ADP-ribosyl-[dinitrogen reductase] hydrolase